MKKLNLGCGIDYREGFVNVDFHDHVKPDIVHNLNQFPYPFADGEFEFILASHIIEHLASPFDVMKELHRILKVDGTLHIKVPHFSRGLTHSEHKAGFDVTFPYYFNPKFYKSGYFGVDFELKKLRLHYFAMFHVMKQMGISKIVIACIKPIGMFIDFFANLSPKICSRVWCYWVGGFEELEMIFKRK